MPTATARKPQRLSKYKSTRHLPMAEYDIVDSDSGWSDFEDVNADEACRGAAETDEQQFLVVDHDPLVPATTHALRDAPTTDTATDTDTPIVLAAAAHKPEPETKSEQQEIDAVNKLLEAWPNIGKAAPAVDTQQDRQQAAPIAITSPSEIANRPAAWTCTPIPATRPRSRARPGCGQVPNTTNVDVGAFGYRTQPSLSNPSRGVFEIEPRRRHPLLPLPEGPLRRVYRMPRQRKRDEVDPVAAMSELVKQGRRDREEQQQWHGQQEGQQDLGEQPVLSERPLSSRQVARNTALMYLRMTRLMETEEENEARRREADLRYGGRA
jgi:hypothetical protein